MSEEILPRRDLIKDELSNYYFMIAKHENKMILVNAIQEYANSWILSEEYLKEHAHEYVGFFPTQLLKSRIESLSTGKSPDKIYLLESLKEKYDIVVDVFHQRDPQIKA